LERDHHAQPNLNRTRTICWNVSSLHGLVDHGGGVASRDKRA
jgi:hypothetical protein